MRQRSANRASWQGNKAASIGFMTPAHTAERRAAVKVELAEQGALLGTNGVSRSASVTYILELQVAAEYQRCGLGSQLLEIAERSGKGNTVGAMLTAQSANTDACRFYKREGYSAVFNADASSSSDANCSVSETTFQKLFADI